jgi:ABC-type multidrug transport system fused ATPase/permease subunit
MNFFKKVIYIVPNEFKRNFIFLLLLMIIGMLFEILGLGIVIPILALMLTPDISVEYPQLKPLLEFLNNPTQKELILGGIITLISVYIIKSIFVIYLTKIQSKFGSRLCANLSRELFNGYVKQPYVFHLANNSSRLIKNIQVETIQFLELVRAVMTLLVELTIIVGVTSLLIYSEPIGALIMISFFVISSTLFQQISKKKLITWGAKRQFYELNMMKNLVQGLNGIKDVKVLNKEKYFIDYYVKNNFEYHELNMKYYSVKQYPRVFLEILSVAGLMGLVFVMILQGRSPAVIMPIIGVFAASAFRLMPSFNKIIVSVQTFRFSQPIIDVLFEELKNIRRELKQGEKEFNNIEFKEAISIENLDFQYPSASEQTLSNFNLLIQKGQSIGILGPSGSGKSTFVNIFLGLLYPQNGTIKVDDINIATDLRGWRNIIGYVPQSIYLIDDTIISNIAFGVSPEEVNLDRINEVIKLAQLTSFIEQLPEELNTNVGERGVKMSGGQLQRIGIARALYNNPSILVLDESTSALDNFTEREIMKSVELLLSNSITVIIIAHRLTTLEKCDVVYRLEKHKKLEIVANSDLKQH